MSSFICNCAHDGMAFLENPESAIEFTVNLFVRGTLIRFLREYRVMVHADLNYFVLRFRFGQILGISMSQAMAGCSLALFRLKPDSDNGRSEIGVVCGKLVGCT